ncbi:TPA: hypothetical protein DIC40_08570 [Patescibacteria group bacterium]|nr:hypothetical protein [Candidatus Gracilibacteria bacterium]
MVKDIYSGNNNSSPSNFIIYLDKLYFRADNNTN